MRQSARDGHQSRAARRPVIELYRQTLVQVRPWYPHLLLMIVLGFVGTPIALLAPLPIKLVTDQLSGQQAPPALLQRLMAALLPADLAGSNIAILAFAAGLVVVIAIASQTHAAVQRLLSDYVGLRMAAGFRARLFLHAQFLSLSRHERRGVMDAQRRIDADAAAIRWLVAQDLVPLVISVVNLVVIISVTASISPGAALIALAISPLFVGLTALFHERLRNRWELVAEREGSTMAVVQEVLSGLRVVRSFGQESREHDRFQSEADRAVDATLTVALAETTLGFLVGLLLALGTAGVLYLGGRGVQEGTLSVGDLLLVIGYLGQIYQPLQEMGHQIASQQRLLASLDRCFSLLDEPVVPAERPGALPLTRAAGAISFERVSFEYEDHPPVLSDIDFAVPAGARVGIIGRSGAGKSSLIGLLIRLYDPTTGTVRLDGTDLRDLRLADLRRQFSVVSQDVMLFSTTVAANIGYGRPEAGTEAIIAAARMAGADEFIAGLPDGYATMVGERGARFSGGERQRLSLARAFLRDAPILILDEPTSAVDVRTEAEILRSLDRLMAGRTTFMVTHRLSALQNCDRLIVMAQGRVISFTDDIAGTIAALGTDS